jgi:hypothetical protein
MYNCGSFSARAKDFQRDTGARSDPRVQRLWEDWDLGADHAKPKIVMAGEGKPPQ